MFENGPLIEPGVWIEVLDLNPETEQVEIKNRWEVEKIDEKKEGNIKRYKVTCKILNIRDHEKNKQKLAKDVLKKHSEKLKASFAKCLVEGISTKSIPDLKHILNKLGEKVKDGK